MKNKFLISLLVLFVLYPFTGTDCQETSPTRDKFTLLTMPYNKRPLTLYRGQFRINAGYEFGVRAKTFDDLGDRLILKDEGTASVFHYYLLQIKYGILDFLEISAETNYLKHGIRAMSTDYYSGIDVITVNTLTTRKGMGDMLLQATMKLPVEYTWFDFALTGGIFLPTAEHQTPEPAHSVTDVLSEGTYTINYHYNSTNGYGVPLFVAGASAKLNYSRFTLETGFSLRNPLKEGENRRWDEILTPGKTFVYTSQPYDYLLNSTLKINASLHYQAAGWFSIGLNSSYISSKGGWTEYWGNKYSNPEEYMFTLEPGFEIQVSPAFRIYEFTGLPVAGRNMDAPAYVFITMSYSLIPFNK